MIAIYKKTGKIYDFVGYGKVKVNGEWVESAVYEGFDNKNGGKTTFTRTKEDFDSKFKLLKSPVSEEIPHEKFVSSARANKIKEWLEDNGYTTNSGFIYIKHIPERTPGKVQLQIRVTILGYANKKTVYAETIYFRTLAGLQDHIRVNKQITCINEITSLENSMDNMNGISGIFNLSI